MKNTIKAFVYVEAQVSVPFEEYDWDQDNTEIKQQPGFISKTWLSGSDNNSIGGFYAFDSIDNAKKYATEFMSKKAVKLNIGMTTRVFSADRVQQASTKMKSPFFE
jgi:hypothetical protein